MSKQTTKDFYLAPKSWSSDNWRDVYTIDEINRLPDDWCADEDDCDYLGEFESVDDAKEYAHENYSDVNPQ